MDTYNNKKRTIEDVDLDGSVGRIKLSERHLCKGFAIFPTGEFVAPYHKRILVKDGTESYQSDIFCDIFDECVNKVFALSNYNVLGFSEDVFSVYNIKNKSFIIKNRDLNFEPSHICYNPQTETIYFSYYKSVIAAYDANTFTLSYEIRIDTDCETIGIVLLNNDFLAVCLRSSEISILDLKNRRRSAILFGNDNNTYVTCMALIRNGVLASAYSDKSIVFWDTDKKEQIFCFVNVHNDHIENIVVINDKYIATGSRDYLIKIWNIEDISSPQMVKLFVNGGKIPEYTGLHPGGYLLSSYCNDLKIWDLYEFLYKDDLIDAFSKSEIVIYPCVHNAFSVFLDNYK